MKRRTSIQCHEDDFNDRIIPGTDKQFKKRLNTLDKIFMDSEVVFVHEDLAKRVSHRGFNVKVDQLIADPNEWYLVSKGKTKNV